MAGVLDVVALGDCGIDVYARVERLPGHDEKVPGDFLGMFGGGVAANFACAASALGLRTALLSSVGDDDFGRRTVRSLAEWNVETAGVVTDPTAPTHFCFVALDATGEKALTIVRTPTFYPRWDQVRTELIDQARLLHIAPFDPEVARRAAEHARAADVLVSVDLEPGMAGGGLDAMVPLLASTTLLLPNELCLELLFGAGRLEEGAEQLLSLGPEAVVVTRGAKGVYIRTAIDEAAVPAFPADVVDTTGAGDCFNAALVSRWLQQQPLEEAARFAAAAAALSIGAVGARGRLPSQTEVEAFLAFVPSADLTA